MAWNDSRVVQDRVEAARCCMHGQGNPAPCCWESFVHYFQVLLRMAAAILNLRYLTKWMHPCWFVAFWARQSLREDAKQQHIEGDETHLISWNFFMWSSSTTHMYIRNTHTCTCTTRTPTHIYIRSTHTYTNVNTHAGIRLLGLRLQFYTYLHTYTYTYIHAHTYMHTHTCTHTHIHTCRSSYTRH